MDYRTIGINIKAERIKQHMTQERLAEKAGISTNFLACIETGIKNGSFETYISIANALHVTLDTLTQDVVSACSENPLKDELNYYFDNSDASTQRMIVKIAKTVYDEKHLQDAYEERRTRLANRTFQRPVRKPKSGF